jgi:hypothetical protein
MEAHVGGAARAQPLNALAQVPDSHSLRSLGARLLGDELIVFPVRHHSPACALQLARLIRERRPSLVLVEGPRSFDPLIPLLTDESARTPLAIYTYAVGRASGDDPPPRHAAYYPFCDYSPELVALRLGRELSVPVRFIDLDFAEQCQIQAQQHDEEARSLMSERHLERSAHLRLLAGRLGCRDHEELWEHLFECPGPSRELSDHVADVAAYCQLARYDWSEEELRRDGTLAREAEMAWHIREGVRERVSGSGPVLAVVGGFHAVVLPDLVEQTGERPQISRSAFAEESSALIRYSFDRLDRLNGYASGMTSPAWHQRLWERLNKLERIQGAHGPRMRQDAALDTLFDIAGVLRDDHQVSLAMPTLAAAYQHALSLARLRRRSAPVREDVVDAVTSCFIKGDIQAEGPVIYGALHKVMTGSATGRVPAGAPKPPLLRDFEYRARRQRLKIDAAQPRRAQLDIYRRPEHRLTSRLLHGLAFLGIPFAVRTAGPDFVRGVGLNRLHEHWEYSYSAATEAALVEASIFGVTVPLAVADRFRVHLDKLVAGGEACDARAAVALFAQGCTLGLHDHLPRVLAALRSAIAQDPTFQSVALAAGSLGLLWESREPLEARNIVELTDVLRAAFERAVYLGSSVGAGGDKDSGTQVMQALTRLREVVVSAAGAQLDASLYWTLIERLATEHDEPIIRGTSVGLLYSAGRLNATDLGALIKGQFIGAREPQRAVGFLRGLLHAAREAAWQLPELLEALDALLASWEEATFIEVLPDMRLAFAELTPRETDRVGEAVAALHGEKHLGALVNYDVSAAQLTANLNLSQTLLAVLEADGLSSWVR